MPGGFIKFEHASLAKALEIFNKDILNFLTHARTQPVIPTDLKYKINRFFAEPLRKTGLGLTDALTLFKNEVAPGLANTAGPRAFPWVIGGVTPAALMGALYQIRYDQINMVSGASIGPKLETETIKLLLDLFDLPRSNFSGNFTTGATASNLVALAVARQWCGDHYGVNIAEEGMAGVPPLQVYAALPHASIHKGMGILGMGRKVIPVATLAGREVIDTQALATALAQSTAKAKIVVATAGTVNTGDFEDLSAIRAICDRHHAWLHVDAAFGLFARCSEQYHALTQGIELADSITVDGHKWLNVPYDCGMLFLRNAHKKHQVKSFSSISDYLCQAADEPMNQGVENSRALRALPAWLSLQAYGQAGYQQLVEQNCAFSKAVGDMLTASEDYQLLAPVRLNIVLFRGKNIRNAEENASLVQAINATGRIFITSTVCFGQPALRIAVCNWQTQIEFDLQAVATALSEGMTAYQQLHQPEALQIAASTFSR